MDHFGAAAEAEQRLDVGAALADDAGGVPVAVGDHTARDFRAIGVEHAHGVAALEPAADRGDARRQQALARPQRLQRAGIDGDGTARAQRAGDPLLARVLRIRRGQEPAAVGALFEPAHRMQRRARGDGHGAAGGGGDLRRGDLGGHAARAHGGRRAATHGFDLGRDVADFGDQPRGRVEVRDRRCTGPATSDSSSRQSALVICATRAASRSLSP